MSNFDNFLLNTFNVTAENIYAEQREIAQTCIYNNKYRSAKQVKRRTGALRESLFSPQRTINMSGGNGLVSFNYPTYIRYLDMKRGMDLAIHNKVIWKHLYKGALKKIKAEMLLQIQNLKISY